MSQDLDGFSEVHSQLQVGGLNADDSVARFAPLDSNNAYNTQR
jgi:hypothetical protein